MPPEPNWANRTIFTGDNLEVMRGMNTATVDLIYLDPPFNSKADYSAPIGSDAAGAAFKDTWTLSDVDLAWHGEIAERQPAVYAIIDAAGIAHGPGMKSYLIMMAVRLLEIQRLLKPDGSLYLHCDDAAGHYLKMLLDAILGAARYRNAITWRRATAHNDPGRYGRISDYLLFYAGDERTWNTVRIPLDDDGIAKAYPKRDAKGRRYRSDNLTGPMHGRGGGRVSHRVGRLRRGVAQPRLVTTPNRHLRRLHRGPPDPRLQGDDRCPRPARRPGRCRADRAPDDGLLARPEALRRGRCRQAAPGHHL